MRLSEYLLKISEIENPSIAFAFRERKCDAEVGVDTEDFKFIHVALFLKNDLKNRENVGNCYIQIKIY